MDLYEEMGYGKKKDSEIPAVVSTPAPNSQVPQFEVSIKPGDPDYELAKTDPVGYSKKLLAEQKAAIPVAQAEPTVKPTPVKKTGGVDLFNEMYGAEAKKPLRVKQAAPVKKEGVMEGLVIPTGEAALRVGGALAGSLATGTGAIATHVPYMVHDIYKEIKKGKSFKEAFNEGMTKASNRSIETMEFPAKELLKTPEQQESFEKIMTPLGLAGAGWRGMAEYAATGDLQKAADVAEGKSMGSSVLVPWAGAFGDTAFMYALMGKNAVKARWYQMTVKERALVREAAKEVKANIKDSNLTNEQVRELWRDPANREGLRRRFVFGETEEVAAKPTAEPPTKASGVTEQPAVGYEKGKVHPLADMMNVLPEAEMLDLAGAKGEGFTVKPVVEGVVKRGAYSTGEIPRVLPVEYKPYISRNGRPFATEEKAEAVALERGFNPKEFEVVPVEVGQYKGFGYVRTTPVKQKLPIPGQESLAKRMVREVVEERKSEIPEGKLEVPVQIELPKPVELSKFDQMKLETLQKTDPALWNASDKVFMQKLGQPMPLGTPVEKPLTAPAESYTGQRAPEVVERMSEAYSEQQRPKAKPEPTAEPVEEPAFKVTDKRSFKDILNDINTALGKKGEVGKDIEVAPESAAARARLREDLARFSEAAKREGKDVEQYMKESGMSAEMLAALTKLNREVGDVSKVDMGRKGEKVLGEEAEANIVHLIPKNLKDFHTKLHEDISTGAKEILSKVEAYEDWKFVEGDRVQSKKTGHIWKITARSWNKKENKPTYYAEDLTEPGSKSLFNKGMEETFIKLDGPRSTTLYEGIDPTQTIAVLKGLAKNTREAYNYLSEVGQRIHSSGKTDFVSWKNEFKTALGELWEQYKTQVAVIWNKLKTGALKPLMNERGSVGYDIGGERIAKQRDLGTLEDGTKLKAPAITEKEFKLLRSLPDMKKKPIGGFTQNPIYAFEDWAASVGPKAQTWVKEKFYYPIREATHRADLHFKNIFDQVEARRKNLPHSSSRRIYYYAISKEAGGAEILKNMGVKEVPKLTEGELEAYNWMRKGYESMYKQINAARIASGIEPIAKVKDYFTFAADMTLAEELGFGFNDAMLGKFVHPKATRFRYAIERIGGIQKVHTDGFGIFERYMKAATKHIYLSPEIAKMREFTGKFDLGKGKTWSMQRSQPRAYANITKYLDFLTGERRTILPDAIERAMVMLNKNITTATLSTNLRSALIQPTALHNTYIEIGPKYTMKGAVDLMRGKGAEAIQKSKVLFNREFDIDIKQTYEGVFGRIGSIKKAINDSWLGMKPLKYLDMQTATTTWLGAFEKAKEVYKMPEEKAIRYADDTVIRTQGSAAAHDLAPLQRIALGRFFSTFQSFVINNFNFLAKDVVGIKNPMMKPAESLHKVGRYVLGAVIINTIFEEVLGINSPLPAPVRAAKKTYDKNGSEKEAAVSAMLELLQVVPGFGGLRYGSGVTGAGIDYLKDVTNKLAEEAGEYRGKTKSWSELAGKAMGIPGTGQVTKTTKILEKGGTLPEAILGRYPETSKNELLNLKKETSFDFDKE